MTIWRWPFPSEISPGHLYSPACGDDARCYVLPSPFPKDNLCVLVADRIATTYRRREATRESLARLLEAFVRVKRGNYLLYFPSYQYMTAVHEALGTIAPDIELAVQHAAMEEHERSAFLDRFSESNETTLVGLAVMGVPSRFGLQHRRNQDVCIGCDWA